uniref:hypothetical protein n=1 Tax=Alistipes onderdonkii TaxID=328813 RepID=UPI004025BA48
MKTLKSLLYVFLAAFLFVGCNDDENFNPGEPEDPDCYSVYFPTQENIGSKELDPAAPTEMTFTVRRLKSEGAIVVPVAVKSSEEGIFIPSQIEFADGQEETTFSIQFPQAEIGTTYKCEVNIEDKKYASVYGEKATGFAFSVTRVKWNKLTGEGGETMGKWRDDVISSLFNTPNPNAEVDVEIYERADKPGYYRMNPYTQTLIRALFNGTAQACTEPNIIIDATNPNAVWIPYQTTGVTLGSDGEIEIASKVNANFSSVSESASLYGTLKDGIISFPATGIMVNFTVTGGWYGANNSGLQRIMLPGAKAYDYTLSLTNTEPADGVVKVGFKFGADVAKVKYAFFNGSMSDALADVRSGEIESGETPSTEITASGTVSASFDDTGVYSVVGNMYNAAGELVGRSYLSFGYVKSGEESQNAVILSVRTELSWEKEAMGYTPENSIKAILFGQNIQSGYWGLFKTADLTGLSTEQLGQVARSSGDAFTDEELAKINSKESLVPFLVGLNSGTSYTLLVSAFNGYFSKVYAVEQTTQGAPDPYQIHYMPDDILGGYTKEGYLKTWNYYAVDVYDKTTTSRQFLGQVVISENTTDDTPTLDYVNISGISTLAPDLAEKDDTFPAVWQNGFLYPASKRYIGKYSSYFVQNLYSCEESTSLYSGTGLFIGGRVADGFVAFVPNPDDLDNPTEPLTFAGMYFGAFTGYDPATGAFTGHAGGLAHVKWLLLVDPAVDTKTNTSAVAKAVSVHPNNYVELRGSELIRALQLETNGKPVNHAKVGDYGTQPDLGVADATTTFSEGVMSHASGAIVMIGKKVSVE